MAAKALAGIDEVSGGRLVDGAGVGPLRSELSAAGVEFEGRSVRGAFRREANTIIARWRETFGRPL